MVLLQRKERMLMPAYKEKNKDSWYVQFYYKDWTGKNKKKLKRGFQTKKEATEWERSFVMQQSCNLDMKFKDFWEVYKTDVKPQVKYNTWITKEYIVELKIMPYFKEKKINEITVRDILQWQNTLRSERDEKGNPYKGTYLKTINAQLSAIFNHAVRFYKLRVNPARQAGAIGTNDTEEMLFWTKDEYLLFIAEVANKAYTFYAFELLYWCGIRLGELLALTPADFDFEKNVLSITKSFQKIKGKEYITPPKTKKSVRKVVMSKNVSVEMKNFIDSIYGIKDTDRIFTITKSYLHHEMNRGVRASGVKRIRVHDLRHSHVSLLINMGFSAVAIGNRVGHESEKITYRYAHMFPTVQTEMAEKLDEEWEEGFDVTESI